MNAVTGVQDYERIFAVLPTPYLILSPDLRILGMNEAYLAATKRRREDLIGRPLFDAFPSAGEPRQLLEDSLTRAREQRRPDDLALIRYPIARPPELGGGIENNYWSATHTPVLDAAGEVALLIQQTQDVTEFQRLRGEALGGDMLRRAGAVQAQAADLRRMFMQAPGFVAVLKGHDHVFELANNAYNQLVGHRDILGRPLAKALPEVVEQGFVALLDGVRETGEPFVGRAARLLLQRAPDGPLEECFLDFIYQPIFGADGRVTGVFVQGSDVTEIVRGQEKQRLLLDELNHRVKNTLATVQAIAHQTLRGAVSAGAFVSAFEARLMALSKTHNALTDSHWRGADLRTLLQAELAPYGEAHVTLDGPSTQLDARSALAFGMVFHELATNAAKYGALSAEGQVTVVWTSDAGRLELEWRESGGPAVAPPSRRGFGSRLIQRSIGGELGGEAMIDYRPEGLVVRLTAPI